MSRAENNEKVEAALSTARRTKTGWRAVCPFCAESGHVDRKTSLQVLGDGRWWCYRSGEHPEVKKGKLPNPPDPSFVARAVINAVKRTGPAILTPPPFFVELADDESETLRPAREYLLSRGHDRDLWRRLQLGACFDGKWAGRIIVPAIAKEGDAWYGWIGRLWCTPKKSAQGLAALKYLYPPGMTKDAFLYNQRVLSLRTQRPVMLVEGAFDCFPFPNDACAALGEISESQKFLVWQTLKPPKKDSGGLIDFREPQTRPLAIVLDGDAWVKGEALAQWFRIQGVQAGSVRLPPRKDPDEIKKEWLEEACLQCIEESKPVKVW